jgi:hypothetical protein
VDFDFGVYDAKHRPVRRVELRILQCPSMPPMGRGYSDYAGVHHDREAPIDVDNHGVFFLNSRLCYEDLWDGASQTLFIGEKWSAAGDLGWMSGTRATLRNAGAGLQPAAAGMGLFVGGTRYGSAGRRSLADAVPEGDAVDVQVSDESLLNQLVSPALVTQYPGEGRSDRSAVVKRPNDVRLTVGTFSSPHPGGGQWAGGDGSVRFWSQTAAEGTLSALAHRADGTLLRED